MEDRKKILLVEGTDDKLVIDALLAHYKLEGIFEVEPCGGITNLLPKFEAYLKNPTAYSIIGIVVDADTNIESRWQQVRNYLGKTGKYSCSKQPIDPTGIIVVPNDEEYDAKVGVWIMPDNQYTGYLEDFLINMVCDGNLLMDKVETTLCEIETEQIQHYKQVDRTKAKIHTYLSWEKKPGESLKTAIMSHVLDANSPIAITFASWLKKLFIN